MTVLESIESDDPDFPDGIHSTGIDLGRTNTTDADASATAFLSGCAAVALADWKVVVLRMSGPVFLRIDRCGRLGDEAISPHLVNAILKKR